MSRSPLRGGHTKPAKPSTSTRSAPSLASHPVTEGGYRVQLSPGARRDLHRLPAKVAPAVIEFCSVVLAGNPLRVSKPLDAPFKGLRTARRGHYRVLLEVDDVRQVVVITRIDHRSNAYRPW
ncbi:MAG: type II toxin-antitoxin system RelE family toxin [Angustibacter sp.]